MTETRHPDRRNLGTKPTLTWVEGDALVQSDDAGTILHRFSFDAIADVRLAVEMAGQTSQVVCRVRNHDKQEIVFGSMTFKGPGVFEGRYETFSALLRELHVALLPHRDRIRFLEGQSMAFMITMFALGALILAMGIFFFIVLFLQQENPMGLGMIAVIAGGVWLVRLFWPRGPKAYDPETYARTPEAVTPPAADQ